MTKKRQETMTINDQLATPPQKKQKPQYIPPIISTTFPIPPQTGDPTDSWIGLTGGEVIVEMLVKNNVKAVFGYGGGAILTITDAIHLHLNSENPKFEFFLPRHEQGGGHMAEGYSAATGLPGVCLVTSGPGATNMITPMQDALMDGRPMIVIAGQVPQSVIGTDAFQEADMISMTKACTKWNVQVKNVHEIPYIFDKAFEIATSGRPGPIFIEIPKDVSLAKLETSPLEYTKTQPQQTDSDSEIPQSTKEAIQKTATALNNSKNPILYVGAGMLSHASGPKLLKELADKGNFHVTTTIHALGIFDETDERSLHMLGMHGSVYANIAMQNSDCIVSLGARFDDRCTGTVPEYAPRAREAEALGKGGLFHFDIKPENIGKRVKVTVGVVGDVIRNIKLLTELVEYRTREEWGVQCKAWKLEYPFTFKPSLKGKAMKPQEVLVELENQTKGIKEKVLITTGVGQHQMWAAQLYRWTKPRTMITSGGLGTMGFGLPAAIGAKVAFPDKIVIDIDGDSSFSMTGMELMTARAFNIKVKVLILNNSFQGMVKQWQEIFHFDRYSQTRMENPDFVLFAESMGVKGIFCDRVEDLEGKMREFLEYEEGPVLFNAIVEKDESCLPMVSAGKALHNIIYVGEKDV